ncbi:hypothetical protein KLA_15665 [Cellulophaga geojensis KL-A]|uniref:Uncharacterized protein n=1 Tax=Cellulophaga geojensis KL-A TaxID=1328323 RepID=A0ABN0RK30_9FLAO|nr:hypothetical protein [Cellulophaga geojensis]EWH11448.1 hypothetical protein KLA_15665 [Cellulophaga geojensis KL-A]
MGRVTWKENKVLSIETRKGVFALAQMIKSPYIIFFNCFREDSNFKEVDLENIPILFLQAVTRQFLKKSNLKTLKLKPIENYQPPKLWIDEDAGSRTVKVWKGTEKEREFITFGENGATLVEKDILKDEKYDHPSGLYDKSIKQLNPKSINIIDIINYELTSVEVYPNLNERLFLCHLKGENVNPAKDILFNIDIPLEYEKYVDIISGTVPLEKLGY